MTNKIYGKELKERVLETKARIESLIQNRYDRINMGYTDMDDCWLSQRVDEDAIHECNLQLEILDSDGMMDFDAIFDENGKEVRINCFINKWNKVSWVGNGIFASTKEALLKKTGWTERTIRVPVWTAFKPSASFGSTTKVRWHTNMVTGEYVGYPN